MRSGRGIYAHRALFYGRRLIHRAGLHRGYPGLRHKDRYLLCGAAEAAGGGRTHIVAGWKVGRGVIALRIRLHRSYCAIPVGLFDLHILMRYHGSERWTMYWQRRISDTSRKAFTRRLRRHRLEYSKVVRHPLERLIQLPVLAIESQQDGKRMRPNGLIGI